MKYRISKRILANQNKILKKNEKLLVDEEIKSFLMKISQEINK